MLIKYMVTTIRLFLQQQFRRQRERIALVRLCVDKYLGLFFCLVGVLFFGTAKAQDYDYIKPFHISRSVSSDILSDILKIVIAHYHNQKIADDTNKLSQKDIEYVNFAGKYKLAGLESDSILLFQYKLNPNLPEIWYPYNRFFVVDNCSHKTYLLKLDAVEPIQTEKSSNVSYLAGRYKDRNGYGVFKIYQFIQGILTQVFQSDEYVSNNSFDCISYENGDLELNNVDVNGDGYLDIEFSGRKNFYCDGNESFGRGDREPIRTEPLSIVYYFDPITSKWKK